MKKAVFTLIVLAAVFLVVLGDAVQAQTVSQWGSSIAGRGNAWPILNRATTPAGNASMGSTAKPSGWATLCGSFTPVTINTGETIVVTGQLTYVGGGAGNAYTGLRYALYSQDSLQLVNQNTDSAKWISSAPSGATKGCYGYEFDPRSGASDLANGTGGGTGASGNVWLVNNSAAWNSTNTNNGGPIAAVLQAPHNAPIIQGTYNWAISVTALSNGTNQISYYLVEQNNKYWVGGTCIDTKLTTTKFNMISFGVNNDIDATTTAFQVTGVTVSKGNPITVPAAPWAPIYVENWGSSIAGRGNAWPIKNDSTYVIGDAMMGGTTKPSGWATICGNFGEPVTATTSKAIVITGQLEYVGGGAGNAYTGLRYALYYQDSLKLVNKNKDSAAWVTSASSGATKGAYGYEFDPRSGASDLANGTGGGTGASGNVWIVNNSAAWNSTNTNNGGPIAAVLQAPHNAPIIKGVYNFAISVQPLSNGTNQISYYLVEQNNKYWVGGTCIDASPVSTKFNMISFGVNNDVDATTTAFKLYSVKVDMGNPITVPTAPWVATYIDQWGFVGNRIGGWHFTPGGVIGNATISGTKANDKWAAIRGGFDPVTPTTAKALVLTGNVEFVGGGLYNPGTFRFGTFYSDVAGKVIVDSAAATLPDSTRWDGLETYTSGYLFVPPISSTGLFSWTGVSQAASSGAVINGAWLHTDYPATGGLTNSYTLGADVQTPANAQFPAGIYDFTITAYAKSTTSNDVRWKLAKQGGGYSITGKLTDTHSTLAATKFNSINFAISGDSPVTGLKLTNVKVDYVDVASIPITASPQGVTAVEQDGTTVPTVFGLSQNYPNPFNPSTTIGYDIAKPAYVTVRVFDVLGRMVAQLVDGVQTASSYSVRWNAASLSSGTYLYRIDARNVDGSGTFSSVKKLVLMK